MFYYFLKQIIIEETTDQSYCHTGCNQLVYIYLILLISLLYITNTSM